MPLMNKQHYDSLTYMELLHIAKQRGIKAVEVPFRGVEYDPQLVAARESLIARLESSDAKRWAHWSLLVAGGSFVVTLFGPLRALGRLIRAVLR